MTTTLSTSKSYPNKFKNVNCIKILSSTYCLSSGLTSYSKGIIHVDLPRCWSLHTSLLPSDFTDCKGSEHYFKFSSLVLPDCATSATDNPCWSAMYPSTLNTTNPAYRLVRQFTAITITASLQQLQTWYNKELECIMDKHYIPPFHNKPWVGERYDYILDSYYLHDQREHEWNTMIWNLCKPGVVLSDMHIQMLLMVGTMAITMRMPVSTTLTIKITIWWYIFTL